MNKTVKQIHGNTVLIDYVWTFKDFNMHSLHLVSGQMPYKHLAIDFTMFSSATSAVFWISLGDP